MTKAVVVNDCRCVAALRTLIGADDPPKAMQCNFVFGSEGAGGDLQEKLHRTSHTDIFFEFKEDAARRDIFRHGFIFAVDSNNADRQCEGKSYGATNFDSLGLTSNGNDLQVLHFARTPGSATKL